MSIISLPLISFFVSLLGIVFMLWRKLTLFRNGVLEEAKHAHPLAIDLEKAKYLMSKGAKKLRYGLLFVVLKLSIKASNFLKIKWSEFREWLKNKMMKRNLNTIDGIKDKKEVSKYLRIISDYQKKIRNMKYRIKKEEGIE